MKEKVELQKEMSRILQKEYGFRRTDTKLIYRALLETLMDSLLAGEEVEIRGFGKFYISLRNPQQIKNRFTQNKPNGTAQIQARRSLRFVPSKVIKEVLNSVPSKK